MDDVDFGQYTGDVQDGADFRSPSRFQTPDPAERDPVLDANFETTPWVPTRHARILASTLIPSVEPADIIMFNSSFQYPATSISSKDRSILVANAGEAEFERPARQIKEEPTCDDNSIIAESQPVQHDPADTPAPSSVLPPFTNMFSCKSETSSLHANGVSASNPAAPAQRRSNQPANSSAPHSVPSLRKLAPVILTDNSDDDIIVIEPCTASLAARKKWSAPLPMHRKPKYDDDDVVFIKEEKRDEVIVPDSHDNVLVSSQPPPPTTSAPSKQKEIPDTQTISQSCRQPSQDLGQPFEVQALESQASAGSQPDRPLPPKQNLNTIFAAQRVKLGHERSGQPPSFLQQHSSSSSSRPGHVSKPQAESSVIAASRKGWSIASNLTLPRFSEMAQTSTEENNGHRNGESPTQLDIAMSNPEGDLSWIDEEDNEESDYDRWCKLRNFLKRKGKEITNEERMMLFKLDRDIAAKERVRGAATRGDTPNLEQEEDDDPESLFVPESRTNSQAKHRPIGRPKPSRGLVDGDNDDDPEANAEGFGRMMHDKYGGTEQEPEDFGLTKSGNPRKRRPKGSAVRQKRPQNAREAYAFGQERKERERSKAQKKKSRGEPNFAVKPPKTDRGRGKDKESSKSKDRGRGKGKSKDKEGRGKKSRDVVKNGESLLTQGPYRQAYNGNQNDQDQVGQMILEDLMANDPIADRLHPVFHATVDNPEPLISGRQVKETQFQTLFANIPQNEYATSSATLDKKKLREASKSFGYAKCKAQDGKWLIKGMKSTLYHHQLLGAQWMVQRELSSQPPHGGLLADSMGLGKTVQMLACMVGNLPGEFSPLFPLDL